jgi:Phosphatidylinositol 3- and 4-kinase
VSNADATGWPQVERLDEDDAHAVLREGEVEVLGRMPWSSNATFLVCLSRDADQLLAIYKPQRGERPLWDFPRGTLCNREVAAREVSEALGWAIVPDTVLRDGPAGIGMMQRFIQHDPEEHYFTLLADHADEFRRMAAFDIAINNTDRKGGHCLRATDDGSIFGIDHGVSFHTEWKLRTVIWDFACEPIPPDVCTGLTRLSDDLRGDLGKRLSALLDRFEIDAVKARVGHLLATGEYPDADRDYHSYPWPTI